MLRISCLSFVTALAVASLSAQIEHFSARLTGDQEVPPVATGADGWAIVTVDHATNRVDVFAHSIGITAVAAHLHAAAIGVNGPVMLPLSGGPQTWTGSAVLAPAQVAAITAGTTYVNLHSAAHPGGEIRGQALAEKTTRFTAVLDATQSVPPVPSGATGTMTAFLHEPSRVVVYELIVSGVSGIAAHIHTGASGVNGPVLVPLSGGPTRWCGVSGRLSDTGLADLLAGNLYVNTHSAAFPGGEIRGQLLSDPADFRAALDGAQEVPPVATAARGRACVGLNPDGSLTYRVEVVGLVGTAAHFHAALPGSNGPVVVPLAGGPTVWSGTSAPLSAAQIADVRAGRWYTNVHTAAHPGGEIRGQVELTDLPSTFGMGCPATTSGAPEIGSTGIACVGTNFDITLFGAPAGRPAVVLFGFGRDLIPGLGRLPLSLAPVGGTDCFLLHDNPGVSLGAVTDALGCAKTTLPVPFLPAGAGTLMAQWFVVDPAANPLGIASSNALEFDVR